jgi:two-component system, cell cycle sensor histidine kinase and response regulator CckA
MTNGPGQYSELLERIERFRRHVVYLKRDVHRTADRDTGEIRSGSEARLNLLLTDTSDVISLVDDRGVISYESPSAIRLLGTRERGPRIGTSIFSFCHPEDLKAVVGVFVGLRRHPRASRTIAYRLRHADGSWISIESTYRNLLEEPSIGGVLVSSRGVAEQGEPDELIRLFRYVVKSIDDPIVITGRSREIIFVNESFSATYGFDAGMVLGKPVAILWPEEVAEEDIEEVFPGSERSPGWKGELIHRRQDGTEFPVYVSASVVKDSSGNQIGMVGIIRDITSQKQVEGKLRQLHRAESLSVLVGGIAHNFNNIFAVIMGYASMLENPDIGREKLGQYARVIIEGTERGAHLVQQLMTSIKKTPVRSGDVAVNEVVREKVRTAMETFPQSVLFSVDLDPRELIISADKNQFGQVLLNLFLNARDAMPEGGTVTVSSGVVRGGELRSRFAEAKDIEYVRVTVGDTGSGMEEEVQSRIFEPFFTTKEPGKGIGLGLSVVRGIVESHGGFIDTVSTVGEGSAFSVYVPLLRFEEKPGTVGDEAGIKAVNKVIGDGTVLVVEDEEPLRTMLAKELEKIGYIVRQAADGVEALELFDREEDKLSCVILDIGLPRLGGYETFIRMRERRSDIPVIIASGYGDPHTRLAIETAGAHFFVQKPYKPDHLVKILRDVCKPGKRVPRDEPIAALEEVIKEAQKQPLSSDLPEIQIQAEDQLSSAVVSVYDFIKYRQKRLQHILHFTSLTSHELRTPLAIIRNQLEYGLQSEVELDELKDIVASSYDEIIRLHHLVNDLLTISMLQAGTMNLDMREVEFHNLIKEIYDEVLFLSREKGISVVLARGPHVVVRCDPGRIRQVVFNLIENALKYTPENGKIHIQYGTSGDTLALEISDTGPGIPKDRIDNIFKPFYQVSNLDQQVHRGTGLGLTLVRWIVEAHGGIISVDSEEGNGTTFKIRLPIA